MAFTKPKINDRFDCIKLSTYLYIKNEKNLTSNIGSLTRPSHSSLYTFKFERTIKLYVWLPIPKLAYYDSDFKT